ncbi:MAG TPA: hypothetical protein VMD05_02970 [Candidatus Nanoarchaeia archaeon]|nr:hypothetical protein [Candidatus Nanoarchaeia archaeon]
MLLEKVNSFVLKPVSPYNFELTVRKPAGWWWSTPDEKFEKDTLWTAARFNDEPIGLRITFHGTTLKPQLECVVFSQKRLDDATRLKLEHMLRRALETEDDLKEFYAFAARDRFLRDVTLDLCGMHTVAWPELFPALILAVTLQMAPMKRSNQMMDLLMENYGENLEFDAKTVRYWPSPKKIASTAVEELQAKAKLGYRAKNLVAIAKTLEAGFPSTDDLSRLEPNAAKKKLMTLRGIGEYSAELVMPGMGFPLDVWSAKIFSILLFGKLSDNPREAITVLKEKADKRWGKWVGRVFVYVLNDLPRLSKRLGTDLTSF